MKYYCNNIELNIPSSVYYPAEDSELFADFLVKKKLKGKTVLEIGCGSGLLSIICAKLGAVVTAVDISKDAVIVTKNNSEKNKVKIKIIVSDIFQNIRNNYDFENQGNHQTIISNTKVGFQKLKQPELHNAYDIIIFNAPYLPENEDDKIAKVGSFSQTYLKKDVIKRFLNEYKKHINKNGKAYILISSITNEKLCGKIVARKKIDWEELRLYELK